MSAATEDREKAARYPDGDVLAILYSHHASVHELMAKVESGRGGERADAFEQLKALLSAHETAEQSVVRPLTSHTAGSGVAKARTDEEKQADAVISQLSMLDLDSGDFDAEFAKFKQAVTKHAESEENEEFPTLDKESDEQQRLTLGSRFLAEFRAAGGRV